MVKLEGSVCVCVRRFNKLNAPLERLRLMLNTYQSGRSAAGDLADASVVFRVTAVSSNGVRSSLGHTVMFK